MFFIYYGSKPIIAKVQSITLIRYLINMFSNFSFNFPQKLQLNIFFNTNSFPHISLVLHVPTPSLPSSSYFLSLSRWYFITVFFQKKFFYPNLLSVILYKKFGFKNFFKTCFHKHIYIFFVANKFTYSLQKSLLIHA